MRSVPENSTETLASSRGVVTSLSLAISFDTCREQTLQLHAQSTSSLWCSERSLPKVLEMGLTTTPQGWPSAYLQDRSLRVWEQARAEAAFAARFAVYNIRALLFP